MAAADGNDSTPAATEIYLAEVLISAPVRPTGIAIFNGSVSSDAVKAALFDSNGVLIAASASTTASGTDSYQRLAFATNAAGATFTDVLLLPGTYYVGYMVNGTTNRYNTWPVGSFGAGKITGATYATAFISTSLTVTPPVTFTANLGPIASLY